MTTLKLSIPDELMAHVDSQVAEGRYGSPDELFQALLERDARKRRGERTLKAKIQEAIDDGPAEPMTRAEWDSIEAEALERRQRRNAGV